MPSRTSWRPIGRAFPNGARGGAKSAHIVALIDDLTARISKAIADIEARQGDHTYSKAKASIDRLLGISDERDLALRT